MFKFSFCIAQNAPQQVARGIYADIRNINSQEQHQRMKKNIHHI